MNDKDQRPIDMPDDRDDFLEWAASVDEGVPSVGGLTAPGEAIKVPWGAEEEDLRILVHLTASLDEDIPSARRLTARSGFLNVPHDVERYSLRLLVQPVGRALGATGVPIASLVNRVNTDFNAIVRHSTVSRSEIVSRIFTTLDLSPRKLLNLAGLIAYQNSRLSKAAALLAARSTERLDPQDQDALEEFVKALAEATD